MNLYMIYQSIFKNGPDRLRRNPDRAVLLIRMNTHSHYILISETTPNFQKLAFYRQLQGKLLVELIDNPEAYITRILANLVRNYARLSWHNELPIDVLRL